MVDLHNNEIESEGRLDVLAARVLRRIVKTSNDPILHALYARYGPAADEVIHRNLGPVDLRGRVARPKRRKLATVTPAGSTPAKPVRKSPVGKRRKPGCSSH